MAEARGTPAEHRRRRKRSEWWVVGGVLAVLAGVLAFAARDIINTPADGPVTEAKSSLDHELGAERQAANGPVEQDELPDIDNLIDDDGKTLWVSPTQGPPLDLGYLPLGVEIILAVRPARLLAHPEGEKVVVALGPQAESILQSIASRSGTPSRNMDRLLIGIQNVRDEVNSASIVLRATTPLEPTLETIQPDAGDGRIMLLGPTGYLLNWRELPKGSPPLPRDIDRLIKYTDSDRTVTFIARPQTLLADGSKLFQGELAPLRSELAAALDDDVAAICLSLEWDENFFIELLAVPTLDSSPQKLSERLAAWVQKLPAAVEESVLALEPSPHSRRVVNRLPEMVRRMANYTRVGYNRDCAIVRCYLPATAGHNLIMGAELALVEAQAGGGERTGVRPVAEATLPGSIAERLQKKTSLRFDREELEAALDMLAQDLGIPIEIRGPDLQADGITRNQLFAIDMADRSGEAILVEILRRANPDKLASGPADPRQKLVYVVGPEAIIITTRSRATERGEPLPAVFREAR